MKKILVADDERDIVKVMSARLKKEGYEVVEAFDSLQAIRLAHTDKPDLVVLDIKMPPGSGLLVFENLKMSDHTSKIPVIFMTAYPGEDIMREAMDMGAFAFLKKPFDAKELIDNIKKAIG